MQRIHLGQFALGLLAASTAATLGTSSLLLGCAENPLPGGSGGGQPTGNGGSTSSGGVSSSGAASGMGSGGVPTGSGAASGSGSGGIAQSSGGSGSGSGGSNPNGGGEPSGDGRVTDVSGKTPVTCALTITSAELSAQISTVGVVQFTSTLAGATAAVVQFGETTDYSWEAVADLETPVDMDPYYRAVLLGMPTTTEHHFRVIVMNGTEACIGEDQTITTGSLPAGGGIGNATVEPGPSSAPIEPGFIVNATYNSDWLYILNAEGELVWYFPTPFPNPTRARMSWDGKYMWVRDGNPGATQNMGAIAKIAMDGSWSSVIDVPTSHHDLSVLPDGSIVYIKKNPGGSCDAIYKHAGDGMNFDSDTMVFDVATAFSGGTCHSNSLHYHDSDGSFTISDLDHDAYVKVSSTGEIEWVLGGGQNSDFTGEGASWERQHGHHLLSDDVLLYFNNGDMTGGMPSPVKEVTLDLSAMTATNGFSYSSSECSGSCVSQFMGDVQRLPGGNTFVTYSSMGIAHEVDPAGMMIRSLRLPGNSAGYSEHRPTLYGPPPR